MGIRTYHCSGIGSGYNFPGQKYVVNSVGGHIAYYDRRNSCVHCKRKLLGRIAKLSSDIVRL